MARANQKKGNEGGNSPKDLSKIRKKYPSYINAEVFHQDMGTRLRLPNRIMGLNYQTGGGIVYGTIVEIAGYESTGKSLIAKDYAYAAQQLGGIVLWVDAERIFDFDWAEQNGLDISKIELLRSEEIEIMSDWVRDMILYWRSKLTNNEPILLVCDSIAALETVDNIKADAIGGKAEMGNRAKAIYQFYRRRNNLIDKYGVCVAMINQVRKKVGATLYEAAETMPGGDSTKFYASFRLMLNKSKQVKGFNNKEGKWTDSIDKGVKIGQNIIVEVLKNKTGPPRPKFKTEVYFLNDKYGYVGYNKYAGIKEMGEYMGLITSKGSRYYFKDEQICNGEKNFNDALHTKSKLRRKIIEALGINTISKFQVKLDSIGKNLYPVKAKKTEDENEDE